MVKIISAKGANSKTKILSKLSGKLLKITTVLLCSLAVLLATPWGTQLTLVAANQLSFLSSNYKSGSWLTKLELTNINLNFEQLNIKATEVVIDLHLRCLLSNELCIEQLSGQTFKLLLKQQLAPINTKDNTTAEQALLNVPYGFNIKQLSFTDIHIAIENITDIKVQQFQSSVYIKNQLIEVEQPNAVKVIVELVTNSTEPEVPAEKLNQKNWPLANLPTISLPLDLNIKELNVDKALLKISQNQWQFNRITTTAKWFKNQVNIEQLQFSEPSFGEISSQGKITLSHPYPLNLQSTIKLNHLPLWPELENSQHQLILLGNVAQLQGNLTSQGSVDAKAELSLNAENPQLPFTFELDVDQLVLPSTFQAKNKQTALLNKAAEVNNLALKIQGDAQQQNFKSTLQLSGYGYRAAELALTGNHHQQKLAIEQFSFTDKHTISQLEATAELALHTQPAANKQLNWKIDLTSSGVNLPDVFASHLTNLTNLTPIQEKIAARLQGKLKAEGFIGLADVNHENNINQAPIKLSDIFSHNPWLFNIQPSDIQGQINQLPFSFLGHIKLEHSAFADENNNQNRNPNQNQSAHQFILSPSNVTIKALNNTLKVQGYSDDNWQVQGSFISTNISSDINSLAKLPNLAKLLTNIKTKKIFGQQSSDFTITGASTQPKLSLKTSSNRIGFDDLNAENLQINFDYQPFQQHQSQLSVHSKELTFKQQQFQALTIALAGDINQQHISANWQGELAGKFKLNSTWQANTQLWSGVLSDSLLNFQGYQFSPDSDILAQFDLANNSLKINSHCWLNNHAQLCAKQALITANSGDIQIQVKAHSDFVKETLLAQKLSLQSSLNGLLQAKWQANEKPTLNADFTLSSGSISYLDEQEIILSQWQQGQFQLSLVNEKLETKLALIKANQQPLLSITTELALDQSKTLNGNVIINQLNLKPLQALIPEVNDFNANISSNLSLAGHLHDPKVSGQFSLANGSIAFNRSDNNISELNLSASLSQQQAKIDGSFMIDQALATYSSVIDWQQQLDITANLNADKIPLSFPPNVNVIVAPNLSAHYSEQLLRLTGEIDILDGLLTIAQFPEGSVKVSDDAIIVDDQGQVLTEQKNFALESDIEIKIHEKFKLAGFGFKGNLAGQLKMQQAKQQPMQMYGRINVLNGFYQAYGQDLQVKQGTMTFNGPVKNPFVDFRAERYIKNDDVNVGLSVNGLTDAIELQLFSQPAMDQPEILSYLIRGQGLDSGTGNTAAVGIALGTTLTKAEHLNRLIQKLPLLHDISVNTEVDGDQAQATISGYLGERIYLKYGVGIYEPIDEITVRLYLLNKLWLETVSGIEKSADIYYSFDIE